MRKIPEFLNRLSFYLPQRRPDSSREIRATQVAGNGVISASVSFRLLFRDKRASYNGNTQASQACAVGSIPIARSSRQRMLKITINGESRQFPAAMTVAALVETLGYTGKRIAIERNGEIVPRGRHADTLLTEGDILEIVVAVGGG